MRGGEKLELGSGFVLDLVSERLLRSGIEVPLRAKTFAVLRHLATNPEVLVTKEELFATVWAGASVTDTVLAASISELRKALDEDPREPRHIHTVHRKGYRFAGVLPAALPAAETGPALAQTPPQTTSLLCGRDSELAVLHRELALAVRGNPRLVFVTGEAGEGKTTLVQAFLESLQNGAAGSPLTAIGQCLPEYDVGEPFLPVVESLGSLLRSSYGEELRRVLVARAPDWLASLGEGGRPSFVTQDRLLHELTLALEELTAARPFVLVLEDLHWSDPSTLALLHALSLRASGARLLVVATYRPVDAILGERRIADLKRDVVLKRRGCEIALAGLSPQAVEQYYARRYEDEALAAQLVRVVHARTEGNPLFLAALADDMESRGILRCSDGRWSLHGSLGDVEAAIPQTIREMIEQRMEILSAPERAALEVGAVIGDGFPVALVAAALGETLRSVDDRCVALARRHRFVVSDGESHWPDGTSSTRFRFVHRWYSSVLVERLSATHRRELHAAVAARLESAYGDHASTVAAELAVHFERAGQRRRAAECRLAAGRNLLRHSASDESVAHLERGLELIERDGDSAGNAELVLDLRAHLAMALLQNRGYARPEVGEAYEALLAATRVGGDSLRHLQALTGLATHRFARSQLSDSREIGIEGIAMGERLGLPSAHYLGLALFTAEIDLYQGRVQEAADTVDRVIRESGDTPPAPARSANLLIDTGVYARNMMGLVLETLGQHAEAEEASRAAVARAEHQRHAYSIVSALGFQCVRMALARQWREIEVAVPRCLAMADEYGFAHFRWAMRILLGRVLATTPGSAEEGLRILEEGLGLRRAMQVVIARPHTRLLVAQTYADAGRFADAIEWSRRAVEHHTQETWVDADALVTHGEILLRAGAASVQEAGAMFTRAREIASSQGALLFARRAEQALSELAAPPAR